VRAAPPLTVDIPRQAVWQIGVGLLVLAAALSWFTWIRQAGPDTAGPAWWVVSGLALAALLAGLSRVVSPPCRLCWDGTAWSAGERAAHVEALPRGRLQVTLDLSVALLLRFEPDTVAGARRAVRWIPVGRAGLPPAQWQALRRTVYSAPPHAGNPHGGDGPRTEKALPDRTNERP
jgi:hypothetical protein